MNRIMSSAIVIAGLVFALGGAVSWGQVPNTNDKSEAIFTFNTGGGTGALGSPLLSGVDNTAYGYQTLFGNTTGNYNTASGTGALYANTTGSSNTASGAFALKSNTTGSNNTACGDEALYANTTGGNNTATGFRALILNTNSYNNTATGAFALFSNTTGGENTASGRDALTFNATGYFNTATGRSAIRNNSKGDANTAQGYSALLVNTTGSYNTALGYEALYNSTGSRNTAVGYNAGIHLQSGDNNIYLGNTGPSTESTTMRLGSVQTRTFIAGVKGVPISGAMVTINNAGQLGIVASSARYKRDIADMRERSQGLYQLRPVTFRYKQDAQGQRQYGLIAEDVAKVYPELVTKGADGKVESVQYHELIPMLLNEVQRQQQEIVELKAQTQQVAELKAQNAALAARLERLEQGATRTATAATR